MSAGRVEELWDAGQPVRGAAPADDSGAYVDALRDEAGLVVGAVDWVVRTLTGHDLLAELLVPLAGDFGALGSMREGWGQVATALDAVAGNHDGLATGLPDVWEGGAQRAASGALGDLADVAGRQAEASRLIGEQLGHLLEVSTVAAEVVCAALATIDEVVLEIGLRMAAGPVGAALNAAAAPAMVLRIVERVRAARAALEQVAEVVDLCLTVVARTKALVDAAAVVTAGVAMSRHGRAAEATDETAAAGFR